MIEIEITNYESIGYMKFSFDGFCTITGRNFIGKSALLRAINAALTNQKGDSFIKWGESFCEVHIKTDNMDLLWHKEASNNFYEINGNKISKVGKDGQPKEIAECGFGLISEEDVNLHYCEQYSPLFLVDKRDSKAADLLISMYGLDKFYKALEFCNKDQRKNSDILKTRKEDLAISKRDFERFSGFEEILNEKANILNKKEEILTQEVLISKLKTISESILNVDKEINRLSLVEDLSIPTGNNIAESISELNKIINLRSQTATAAQDLKRLEPFKDIVIPTETSSDLEEKIRELEKIKDIYRRYALLEKEVSQIELNIKDIIIPKVPIIDFDTIEVLKAKYREMQTHTKEGGELKLSLANVVKDLSEVEKELESFDACPVCGSDRRTNNG